MEQMQGLATVAQVGEFDEVIDVRSPSEFADDHVPGAINCPVLSDEERARVGTVYKQVSSFEAKRMGAAMVARNIATHLETRFADRPRQWRPLVYCWRGGGRSDAMVEVMRRVGWRPVKLEGGYKAYRRSVIAALEVLPAQRTYRAVCGRTGSGKSLLLAALAELGAQVLDLEGLASHRGSVLGEVPRNPQPPQKLFESRVCSALAGFRSDTPIYVESESRKVGNVQVPGALLAAVRESPCILLETALPLRVALLRDEYSHFCRDPEHLCRRLDGLVVHHGAATIARWKALAREGNFEVLVAALLEQHYDPAYDRSMDRNYRQLDRARVHEVTGSDPHSMRALAKAILDAEARD